MLTFGTVYKCDTVHENEMNFMIWKNETACIIHIHISSSTELTGKNIFFKFKFKYYDTLKSSRCSVMKQNGNLLRSF